jgi:hypothetical protein
MPSFNWSIFLLSTIDPEVSSKRSVAQCGCSGAAISIRDKRSFVDPPDWIFVGVNGCEEETVAVVCCFIDDPQFLQNTAPGGFTSPQPEQLLLTPV